MHIGMASVLLGMTGHSTVHYMMDKTVQYNFYSITYSGVTCILQVVIQEIEHFEFFRFVLV